MSTDPNAKTLRKRLRRAIFKAVLLLLSAGLTLLVAELLLRLSSTADTPEPTARYMEYHPLLGWQKKPNTQVTHNTSEYTTTERINSQSIRGPEYPYAKPPNQYRILIIGDSFAEATGIPFDRHFAQLLKSELNKTAIQTAAEDTIAYQIITAGTSGYSTDQELLFFQQEGKKYQPDLTVLLFCYNDIWYNSQPMTYHIGDPKPRKPLFELRDGKLHLTNVPVPRVAAGIFDATGTAATSTSSAAKQYVADNSHLYNFIRNSVKSNYRLHKLAIRLGLAHIPLELEQDGNLLPIPADYGAWLADCPSDMQRCWDITEFLLAQLRDDIVAVNSSLIVLNVPIRAAIYDDILRGHRRQYGLTDDHHPDNIAKTLSGICSRLNIDYIDPTDRFRQEARVLDKQNRLLYYPKDGHWNPAGHRLVADILKEHLASVVN